MTEAYDLRRLAPFLPTTVRLVKFSLSLAGGAFLSRLDLWVAE